jgi:hypothetical protein
VVEEGRGREEVKYVEGRETRMDWKKRETERERERKEACVRILLFLCTLFLCVSLSV